MVKSKTRHYSSECEVRDVCHNAVYACFRDKPHLAYIVENECDLYCLTKTLTNAQLLACHRLHILIIKGIIFIIFAHLIQASLKQKLEVLRYGTIA
jgi:hypothetical protein